VPRGHGRTSSGQGRGRERLARGRARVACPRRLLPRRRPLSAPLLQPANAGATTSLRRVPCQPVTKEKNTKKTICLRPSREAAKRGKDAGGGALGVLGGQAARERWAREAGTPARPPMTVRVVARAARGSRAGGSGPRSGFPQFTFTTPPRAAQGWALYDDDTAKSLTATQTTTVQAGPGRACQCACLWPALRAAVLTNERLSTPRAR